MKFTCRCCGYKSLIEEPKGSYEICKICFWEDDLVQSSNPFYSGGANKVSLFEGQQNYLKFGACELEMKKHVRIPSPNDEFDEGWKPIKLDHNRKKVVELYLESITSISELHELFKEKFNFPEFYGGNWNAFWDAITGLVSMPIKIKIFGWYNFQIAFPKDSRILKATLVEFKDEYPVLASEIEYHL